MEDKAYIVVDTRKDPRTGDTFVDVYPTAEEATAAAIRDWNHLTDAEKKNRHICSGVVRREDLEEPDGDEDGILHWDAFTQYNYYPGHFDSEKE